LRLQPEPRIKNMPLCRHGGIDYAELADMGLNCDEISDFSVCTNPFLPSPRLEMILDGASIDRYPDSSSTEFRNKVGEKLGTDADSIIAGNGTTELIRLIAQAYFGNGDNVLILEPAYGEYEVACRIAGATVIKQRAGAESGFVPDTEKILALIKKNRPKGVFICNPNNPTGKYLSGREMREIIEAFEETLFIIDEAYINFVDNAWDSLDMVSRGNVIILRSMTKDYALAGLRLGYAVASREIIQTLRSICPPWNVNIVAQKAGVAVLENNGALEQSRKEVTKVKRFLCEGFEKLGFSVVPSDANFFLVKVGDAAAFRAGLLQHGIMVRDGASFGLPEHIRIGPRPLPECRKLIDAVTASRIK